MRRWLTGVLALLLILATGGEATVAKQDVTVELFYNSTWNDHTQRALVRSPITINHGAGDEQSGVVPSDASLSFRNYDGLLNPDNRQGSLFGLIGHNTPIRITVAGDVRFHGQVVSWKPRRALGEISGTRGNAWVDVKAQGTIRRLGQGEPPIESALYRSILHEADTTPLLAYWPFEELTKADLFGSGITGGFPMQVPANVLSSNDDTLPGSRPLPTFTHNVAEQGSGLIGVVTLAGSVLTWDVWVKTPATGEYFDANLYTEGADGRHWHLTVDNVGRVDLFYYDTGGSSATTPIVSDPQTMGVWHNIRFTLTQNGGNVDCELFFDGVSIETGSTAGTVTAPNKATIEAEYTATEDEKNNIGHMTVWDGIPSVNFYQAGLGYPGELAGERFERLCLEDGIASTIVGDAAETQPMGPQFPDALLGWLEEIARTDAGSVHDSRHELGLTFRTGRSLINQ